MDSNNSGLTEVKIIQRGQYYLTPFTLDHIDEVVENLTQENKRELILLGHNDLHQAMHEMYESSECYLARKEGESFLAIGGLWYNEDQEIPQMFAMFSNKVKEQTIAAVRGSRFLIDLEIHAILTKSKRYSDKRSICHSIWFVVYTAYSIFNKRGRYGF